MPSSKWTICLEFMKAIYDLNYDHVTEMLDNGFDVDSYLLNGNNGIDVCVFQKSHAMAELLLKKGCSLSLKNNRGYTPLFLAVLERDLQMVKLFLDNRADVNQIDNFGWTVMHHACETNNIEIVKLLMHSAHPDLMKKRDINYGKTPFALACHQGSMELVHYLLSYNPPINLPDNQQNTPLMHLIENNKCTPEMVQLLIDHGADLSLRNSYEEIPLLLLLEKFIEDKRFRDVLFYVIERSDVNAETCIGQKLLTTIILLNDTVVLKKVLNSGFKIASNWERINQVLFLAVCRQPKEEIVDILVDSGMDARHVFRSNHKSFECLNRHECMKHLAERTRELKTLKNACRAFIRNYLPKNIEKSVMMLDLPMHLIKYLLLE